MYHRRVDRFRAIRASTALGFLLFAGSVGGADLSPHALTAKEQAEGWVLLFDGRSVAGWKIEGDWEVADGTLVLGGEQKTRAYLPVPHPHGCELRLQYRVEGSDDAGAGWDLRIRGEVFRGRRPYSTLRQTADWRDWFLLEYYDMQRGFQQRFIDVPDGMCGIVCPIDAYWLEVPAGTKLYLRNVRLRQHDGRLSPWLFILPAVFLGLVGVIGWRLRSRWRTVAVPR